MGISRGFRLTWTSTKTDGVFRSARNLKSQTTGAIYKVVKDTNTMTFKIINLRTGNVIKTGGEGINNEVVLHRHIKKALKQLGVKFKLEVRSFDEAY